MSNRGNTKKRRVGGGGSRVSIDGSGSSGGDSELVAIKSMMQELVQQNRTQTNMINSMQAEITQLSKKCMSQNRTQTNMIQSMQGDITSLTKKCNTMETTMKSVKLSQGKSLAAMNSRFDEVNDKLKYQEILLQNQGWKYSAPHPSTEYWSTFDEDEETEAEDFLNHIKKSTEEMRYGTGNGQIEINANLSYNEEMLPHWEEFANALEQYHYHLNNSSEQRKESKPKLRLFNMELPDEVINLLSNALKFTHFEHFALKGNAFGQKGISFVLDYLENNDRMKQITLVNNPINSMNDINKFCEIVKEHPSIENLTLDNCTGDDIDGYEMFKMVMNVGKNNLKHIDLADNGISTEGDTFISDFLATDPLVESLFLDGNHFNDNDAISIASVLKQNNTVLSFLDLTGNNITKTGWAALRKTEFDDTSLNTASDSNHRCNIKYPSDGSDEIEGLDISEMNGDRKCENAFNPKYVEQKKIYSVLSSRHRDSSNLGNFDDVPVEILPNMIHSIQNYSNYREGDSDISQVREHVNPLSLVYEVCRYWDESLAVFEALSS